MNHLSWHAPLLSSSCLDEASPRRLYQYDERHPARSTPVTRRAPSGSRDRSGRPAAPSSRARRRRRRVSATKPATLRKPPVPPSCQIAGRLAPQREPNQPSPIESRPGWRAESWVARIASASGAGRVAELGVEEGEQVGDRRAQRARPGERRQVPVRDGPAAPAVALGEAVELLLGNRDRRVRHARAARRSARRRAPRSSFRHAARARGRGGRRRSSSTGSSVPAARRGFVARDRRVQVVDREARVRVRALAERAPAAGPSAAAAGRTCAMARSASVIGRPRTGKTTPSGRCLWTGSSSATRPSRARSASRVAVKTFVIDPISKIVRSSGGSSRSSADAPAAGNDRLAVAAHADDDPDVLARALVEDAARRRSRLVGRHAAQPADCDERGMEPAGLEPATFWLPARRSPN